MQLVDSPALTSHGPSRIRTLDQGIMSQNSCEINQLDENIGPEVPGESSRCTEMHETLDTRGDTACCDGQQTPSKVFRDERNGPQDESSSGKQDSKQNGKLSRASDGLNRVIDAWPDLDDDLKSRILALIKFQS